MRLVDLTGRVFGRLTVMQQAPRTYQTMWACRCSCGADVVVSAVNLKNGHSSSCGCLREELRPTYAKRRDFKGAKNPRAIKSAQISGGAYVPSSSVWYKRAAGIFYSAKKNKTPVGFRNVAEMASYIKNIAPKKCPVFGKRFVERRSGFSQWSPSIDKIDPKKGYVVGNIQVISMQANCMKRDASPEQLRRFAEWVLKEKK